MSPNSSDAGSPQDWLRNARSDLAIARLPRARGMLFEHLCFHAQQCGEKALKALLLSRDISFPRTHDLAFLLDLMPHSEPLPPELIDLPSITKYAVQQRYPGDAPVVTAKDKRHAVRLAENTLDWVVRRINAL
jgi:HEPN domain-containing protein